MKPLASMSAAEAKGLRGLLFDLDDTLLSHGALTRTAYDALWVLRDSGLALVGVTGRPAGWGEVLVRQWPVEGIVVENGAVCVVREQAGVVRRDACDEAERRARRTRLAGLVDQVSRAVGEARLSDDVEMRRTDVTWDIGERVTLADDRVTAIVAEIERAGARWSRSSVHLHATFDVADKASGVVGFLGAALGEDAGAALVRWAFVGDSGNDAACFAAFRTTIGVANVRAYVSRLAVPPKFVTEAERGEGFAEMARVLARLRAG